MTTGLAGSSFAGEPAMLEAQGGNVLPYVMLLMLTTGGWHAAAKLIESVAVDLDLSHFANFAAKTVIPGLFTGVICCQEGLKPIAAVTLVPVAVTPAIMRSINVTLVVNAISAVVNYSLKNRWAISM